MAVTERGAGVALAYELLEGAGPVIVFCPGYASDMGGTKAMRLWHWCDVTGRAMLRFDYSGHGQSGGRFIDGCIGDWFQDAAHVIAAVLGEREIVLVGSSMGGWISLLLGCGMGARLRGMVLIAPAPDFTERMAKPALSAAQWEILQTQGVVYQESQYGDPLPFTLKLLEDGARHLLMDGEIPIDCPVRVLHGMRDKDVPWQLSLRLAECLRAEDVRLVFLKDGDHRLSREQDLTLLERVVGEVLRAE